MQLGVSPFLPGFTSDLGVGDVNQSYAFDGDRRKRWLAGAASAYGEPWVAGDIIGCCIDLPDLEPIDAAAQPSNNGKLKGK